MSDQWDPKHVPVSESDIHDLCRAAFRGARRRGLSHEDAEEVANDALCAGRAAACFAELNSDERHRYVMKVARNLTSERLRRNRKTASLQLDADMPGPDVERDVLMIDALHKALLTLDVERFQTLVSYYEHGATENEIADTVGQTRGQIHNLRRSALEHLRKRLSVSEHQPPEGQEPTPPTSTSQTMVSPPESGLDGAQSELRSSTLNRIPMKGVGDPTQR